MRRLPLASTALVLTLAACSSSPADVAGSYSVNVTSRDNGCSLQNWTVGQMSSNIPVTITQDGSDVTASVTGLTGTYLDVVLGSHDFTGTIDGNDLDLTLYGTRSGTMGNCTYTYNAVLTGTLDVDTLTGQIQYQAKTNGNPDCGTLEGCASVQDFNGARPPQ
jgi:hypothetical protein